MNENSKHVLLFDEANPNWNENNEYNKMFVRSTINFLTDSLRARGHLFLNEAFDAFGFPRSRDGAVQGWVFERGSRGIANVQMHEKNGYLDIQFITDGLIYDKI